MSRWLLGWLFQSFTRIRIVGLDEPDEGGEESESDCEDEEIEKDSEGCDVESVAAGPVKAVDTVPVESDCTSERCSCDKPNHPNLLHKQLKGNRVNDQLLDVSILGHLYIVA